MKSETVQEGITFIRTAATPGQIKDLAATLVQAIPSDLIFDDAESFQSNKGPIIDDVREVLAKYSVSPSLIERTKAAWKKFYLEEFSMDCTFEGINIPERPAGFDRLIIIAPDITPEQVFRRCERYFKCWKYTNSSLNDAVPSNDRENGRKGYAIWVRERTKADEEHKNKSANDLKEAKIKGMTLLERLVYELKYFKETGNHLDIQNITLCSGSRYSDGNVPSVYWGGDRLKVYWCHPGAAHGRLRAREVAS